MPHNAIIEDLQTGEKLLLWAVISEKPQYLNEISDEPMDLGHSEGSQALNDKLIRNALAENIEFKPLRLSIQADLTGDPGKAISGPGGAGYDIEQYSKLQSFVNRVTVFAYTSYLFVNSTSYHDFSQPGLRITGLGMSKFEAIKGGGRALNIIGAKIEFQSIVLGASSGEMDWDDVWDYGEFDVSDADTTVAQDEDGNAVIASTDTEGNVTGKAYPLAVNYVPQHNVVAIKKFSTLAPVNQQFSLEIEGATYTFRTRKNLRNGFATLAIHRGTTAVIEERKIVYGEDLLEGTNDPRLTKYHLLPLDPTGKESIATPDNLGKTVHLYLIKEGELDPVVISSMAVM